MGWNDMFNYAFKNYLKGFKEFLPFIVINLIFDLVVLKIFSVPLGGDKLIRAIEVGEEIDWGKVFTSPEFGNFSTVFVVILIISLLVAPIINSYITLVIKKLLNNKEVKHLELLKESFHYYFSYIGVTLAIILILCGLAIIIGLIAVFIPVLGVIAAIPGGIFILYLGVVYNPCTSYLIYNNCGVYDALQGGKQVGKKYFWPLLGFLIVINVISKILSLVDTSYILIYIIITLIVFAKEILACTYLTALCKDYNEPEIKPNYEELS
jgi:hypothetical protein